MIAATNNFLVMYCSRKALKDKIDDSIKISSNKQISNTNKAQQKP